MFRLKRKRKGGSVDKKHIEEMLKEELGSYVKREELQEYLEKIGQDREKAAKWDSLSVRKKTQVLRYIIKQERAEHGKEKKK